MLGSVLAAALDLAVVMVYLFSMKRCSKCRSDQPEAYFGKDASRRDGLQVWCKECQRAYREANKARIAERSREWKLANPEKVKASRDARRDRPDVQQKRSDYNREWKLANPEKIKEQRTRAYERDPAKARARSRQYVAENPDKAKAATKIWREHNQEHIKTYRKHHRQRDRDYYERNKSAIRAKKEAQRQWVVYRINFKDGTSYIGSSCQAQLRLNAHRSRARKGRHVKALNGRDFEAATLEILYTCDGELNALDQEASAIRMALAGEGCLNQSIPSRPTKLFWVYVIQSGQARTSKNGKPLPGFFYVGMTTEPDRRLREHNGVKADGTQGKKGGGKYTSKHRPWVARALHGPYFTRSEALRAEYALKRGKRGSGRLRWTPDDSPLCRGEGVSHPWVHQPDWKPPTPEQWRVAPT